MFTSRLLNAVVLACLLVLTACSQQPDAVAPTEAARAEVAEAAPQEEPTDPPESTATATDEPLQTPALIDTAEPTATPQATDTAIPTATATAPYPSGAGDVPF